MKRIFVTGGSGLLGSNIVKIALSNYDVYSNYMKNKVVLEGAKFYKIDLSIVEQVEIIDKIKPDLIIHCAALTSVDYCAENPDQAYKVNVLSTINLVKIAKKIKAYFVHISTDSVFDGIKGDYKEGDIKNPLNIYGKTKLEAEDKVLSEYDNACIIRTNIYGWNKLVDKCSLAEWMISKLNRNETLPGIRDVFFTPILVNDLGDIILELYYKKYRGVLHIGSRDKCSKLDFAYKLARIFELNEDLIQPISMDELTLKALRGKDMSLDVSKAKECLSMGLPSIEDGLRKMKMLRDNGYVKLLKNEGK
jgi:dTDP-4-dehydrorhamnose reductase